MSRADSTATRQAVPTGRPDSARTAPPRPAPTRSATPPRRQACGRQRPGPTATGGRPTPTAPTTRQVRQPAPPATDLCWAAANTAWSAHTRRDPTTPARHPRARSARRAPPAAAGPRPPTPTTTTTAQEKKAPATRRRRAPPRARAHALDPVRDLLAATSGPTQPPRSGARPVAQTRPGWHQPRRRHRSTWARIQSRLTCMFYCHSDNRRTISLASLSGWARIAGVSPDGPGPIRPHWRISTPSPAGCTSNPTSRRQRRGR